MPHRQGRFQNQKVPKLYRGRQVWRAGSVSRGRSQVFSPDKEIETQHVTGALLKERTVPPPPENNEHCKKMPVSVA